MEKIKSLFYGSNRLIAFIMSAMMSFLFYSSLAGSNLFFYWFNGISGVVFDVKRVQLWDDGKRLMASIFIIISMIAFVGSSVSETLKASYKETNKSYVLSLKDNIKKQEDLILMQEKRIRDTPDKLVPQKETDILKDYISFRDYYQKELLKYESENVSDESMTQFQIIADKTGVDVRIIIWVFFIIRATLLEVSVLYDSKKKKNEEYSYRELKINNDNTLKNDLHAWIDKWRNKSIADNRSDTVGRLNMLTDYIGKLEDISKEALYVREDNKHDGSGENGIQKMGKRALLLWSRFKERMHKPVS